MSGRRERGHFCDKVVMELRSGAGGDGCVSFQHDARSPRGGPDGGDGGKGGDVWITCSGHLTSLSHLRGIRVLSADNGEMGKPVNKTGRNAPDSGITVPPGTRILELENEASDQKLVADLTFPGQRFLAVLGGKGGKGNRHFKTAANQVPTRFSPGEPRGIRSVVLDFRMLGDVGVVGPPNAGKSLLIQALSGIPQKVEPFQFSTQSPKLVAFECPLQGQSFLLDLPGCVTGASQGAGMGGEFLKHLDRCRLILCVVDLSDHPLEQSRMVLQEVEAFDKKLLEKPRWLIGNKADLVRGKAKALTNDAHGRGEDAAVVSSLTGRGVEDLKERLCAFLHSRR